jgi:solute carrier family 35 protein
VISISITIFNKAVLSHYQFPYANTLALGQMFFSLLFLEGMKRTRIVEYPEFSWATAYKLKWLTLSFGGMVTTGLASLTYVNIPMYSVLRRLTTWITLIGEQQFLTRVIPRDEQFSIYLMLIGAIAAGWGDLEFNLLGYVLIFVNCIFTAGYLLAIKGAKDQTNLNTFGLMFYNNLFSFPLYVVIVACTELTDILKYDRWTDVGFLFCFLMSSVQAFLLNYFIFLCSIVNSPLTTSITGQIKNILTTVMGFFLFGGMPMTIAAALGLSTSTLASIWYGQIKYDQSTAAKKNAQKVNNV